MSKMRMMSRKGVFFTIVLILALYSYITSPSGSLSYTFCFKSKSISAYGPQGEGGGYLEGLCPSNSSPT